MKKLKVCAYVKNFSFSYLFEKILTAERECDLCLVDEKSIYERECDNMVLFVSPPLKEDVLLEAVDKKVKAILPANCDESLFVKAISNIIKNRDYENILLNQYKKIVDDTLIVSKTDVNGRITYVNDAFEKISGYKKEELLEKNHNIIRHPDMKKEVFQKMWNTILNKKTWKGIIKNRKMTEARIMWKVLYSRFWMKTVILRNLSS
ncbi:PAS domain-containing protein [Nautilia sp.]